MDFPLELSFKDVARTEALDALIREKVTKLERMFDHLVGCRIIVETAARRQNQKVAYRVRIELSVPNDEIVVVREPAPDQREEVFVAVREAFAKATRRLERYKQQVQGEVKLTVAPPHGVVTQVFHGQGYGFLKTPDGRDLYFHENAVIDGKFEDLQPGMEVRYAEADDHVQGPHASTIHAVGKSGHELTL